MAMKFVDGDYIPDGWGGFKTVTASEEILNRILYKLTARRGGFAPFPELGSRLYLLGREKQSARMSAAKQYVMEALADEDVAIEDVAVLEQDDDVLKVTIAFIYEGDRRSLELAI